jgi:hypothetical protein
MTEWICEEWLPSLNEFRTFAAEIEETVNRSNYLSIEPMILAVFSQNLEGVVANLNS